MKFHWEELDEDYSRLRVPGGWVLRSDYNSAMVLIPDPKHQWTVEE